MSNVMHKGKHGHNRIEGRVDRRTRDNNGTHAAAPAAPQEDYFPAFEEIQVRAYQIYQDRGGSDIENWFQAETDLREERRKGKAMRQKDRPVVQTVTKEELLAKMKNREKIQIVNVLSPEQYHLGSIKGAIRIPLEDLDRRMNELDKDQEVIMFCASSDCPASAEAADKLAARGFNVCAYEGGIKEWKEAGYPMA